MFTQRSNTMDKLCGRPLGTRNGTAVIICVDQPDSLTSENASSAKLCQAVSTPPSCSPGNLRDMVRSSLPVPVCPRSRLPIFERQVGAACLVYGSRGAGFSNPQRLSVLALFNRLPSRLSLRARWLHRTIHSLLIATWLFAPYDSWTLTTLFDRPSFFDFTITTTTLYSFPPRC